jgi:hypothetical protein
MGKVQDNFQQGTLPRGGAPAWLCERISDMRTESDSGMQRWTAGRAKA